MAAQPKPTPDPIEPGSRNDACDTPIDRNAPAGSPSSLGSKSDCNGRPSTDDSVTEAIDEQGPLSSNPETGSERRG
jgi:hypothetical protein